MGKKTRKEKRNKTKVHIKVKRDHIQQANEQLRKLYNERFNTNVASTQQESVSDLRTEANTEILTSRFIEVIDFYRSQKYPNCDLVTNGEGDPVKMAFNNLCESCIKTTINHAHECKLPAASLKTLSLKGFYGIDLDSLQVSDSDDEELTNDRKKLNEMVSKTNNLIDEVRGNSKPSNEPPPEAVIDDHQKFF
jgi:hypothetical protein